MKRKNEKTDARRQRYYDLDSISVLHAIQEGRIDIFIQETNAAEQSAETDDAEKRVARALVWWTFVLAAATAIGAVFAGFTMSAIRGQLEEMQTEQRPWIYADISHGDAVFWNQ